MTALTWFLRLIIFGFLLILSLYNTEMVSLRFIFSQPIEAPLIVFFLGFFALGVIIGILALAGTLLKQRHEIYRLKKAQKAATLLEKKTLEIPTDVSGTL